MGTDDSCVVPVTVPLDPSHPGCGKFIISSYFPGEHRGRHFAHRSVWPDRVVVRSPALDQDLQPMAQIRLVTALEPIPSHRTRQAHQAAGTSLTVAAIG